MFWRLPGFVRPLSNEEERIPIRPPPQRLSAVVHTATTLGDKEGIQPGYSTFPVSPASNEPRPYPEKRPSWEMWLSKVWANLGENRSLLLVLTCVAMFIAIYHHHVLRATGSHREGFFWTRSRDSDSPQWSLNHYHYYSPSGMADTVSSKSSQSRHSPTQEVPISLDGIAQASTPSFDNLLIAQAASIATASLVEITSRPNRAYARQWGLDYLLHQGSSTENEQCSIRRVLQHTLMGAHNSTSSGMVRIPKYDAILLLPSHAIITNFDFDLMSLMPRDKVLGITEISTPAAATGEVSRLSMRSLLFWNLHHEDSSVVARRLLGDEDNYSCNLVEAAALVDSFSDESSSNMVATIPMTPDGFVEPRLIQLQQSSGPRVVDMAALQTTADSVCYRFYPKCEVL